MEIAKGNIGPEATYELSIKDAKIHGVATYAGADGDAVLTFMYGLAPFIDKGADLVKKLIPGTYEDAIVDGVAQTLKNALK